MSKKILIITLVILGLAAYVALSFWVIGIIQGKKTVPFIQNQNTAATTTALPQTNFPNDTQTAQPPTSTPTPKPTSTPLPTPTLPPASTPPLASTPLSAPTSLQGPGTYACDPDGICNDYSDQMRKNCPKTFADTTCLGMCGTPSVRCPK
ncbi:MAG: hypothetical protein NT149_03735 [Candidatus Gottesmanbacteria bacterium]|nr:hypothetical protein [Candidatus Gottesmanbacteria bacterium]